MITNEMFTEAIDALEKINSNLLKLIELNKPKTEKPDREKAVQKMETVERRTRRNKSTK